MRVTRVAEGAKVEGRLQQGDVIVEVGRHPVDVPETVDKLLARASGSVLLLVQRGEIQQLVAVKLD